MTMPYLLILVLVACAVFFYESVWIWCGLSLLISAVTLFWLHWGWLGAFSCQLALFVGITLIRMCREK